MFGDHENWVISLNFHDLSSKPSGFHRWPSVWLSFGSLFSWLKYSKIWMWMMENENRILVFSKLENWNSVASSVDKMRLKALKPMHCHIKSQALGYYRWNFPISFHFNPKFSAKFFPLLTSLSQPLLIFTFLFIPSEPAPWQTLRQCSKHLNQTNSINATCYENYLPECYMSIQNTTLPEHNYRKNKQNHKGRITRDQSRQTQSILASETKYPYSWPQSTVTRN